MRFERQHPLSPATGLDDASPWRRLAAAGGAFVALLTFGVIGYMTIEGWSFIDSLYMSVTTVTTVGFREVEPLSQTGQVFTIFLVLFGVGVALYILTAVVRTVVEGELGIVLGERRMKSRIEALRDHYILCGFGRVGEEIGREFERHGVAFVIVENNSEALGRAQTHNFLFIDGDATQDVVLEKAGITRARALMAAADSDAGNTYITLTAKALRPDLFVVARVGQAASEARVRRAGADRVISPYSLAGRRMALSVLQPLMVDFVDVLASARQGEQMLAELVVSEESIIEGRSIHDAIHKIEATTLLAVQHPDGELLVGPPDAYALRAGDRLILLSTEREIEELGRTRSQAAGERATTGSG